MRYINVVEAKLKAALPLHLYITAYILTNT